MDNIGILDCTLRDGGHVNDSDFGEEAIRGIAGGLARAGVDYVEMGFLRNGRFTPGQSSCNDASEMGANVPVDGGRTKFTAMIRPDWYDISQMSKGKQGIDIIRFAFYYRDFDLMAEQARVVRELGYGIICNPVNIMGYTDDSLKELVERINGIMPEQVTIVDTFGALTYESLRRIYGIVEDGLAPNIRIGLHLHENQSLAYGLLHEFLEIKKPGRGTVIDASLLGMGRMPGNLCMEILATHLNTYFGKEYDISEIYRLIGRHIEPLKEKYGWGYHPAYFLTGQMNMHRSYGEYLFDKGLDIYEISRLLAKIPRQSRDEFHKDVIEKIFENHAAG